MAVVRDQNGRAREVVDRLDQGSAAVDVEMVGRLVEDQKMRAAVGGEAERQPRLLAAREPLDRRVGGLAGEAERACCGSDLGFGFVGHQFAHMR